MPARNRNELWAGTLLDELARAGIREVVVAPGSRSTPLVLAAAEDSRFRITVQVDERSAAFLALGVGKASGMPGAVITTSGTAAANLFPAVVEAAWSETPLLLLTADRPPHLRGADANQAIDQLHLFGRYTRFFQELSPARVSEATLRHLRSVASRAVAAAVGLPGGPVHLNLPFDKPLEPVAVAGDLPEGLGEGAPLLVSGRPGDLPFTRISPRRALPDPSGLEVLADRLRTAARPLLVAGPVPRPWETGPALRRLAALGYPLLADPLSGARFGIPAGGGAASPGSEGAGAKGEAHPHPGPRSVLSGVQDLALRSPDVRRRMRPDLVLRFGASPTSAAVLAYLEDSAGDAQVVVDSGERWKDHQALASHVLPWDPGRTAEGLAALLEARGAGPRAHPDAGPSLPGGDGKGGGSWLRRWGSLEAAVQEVLAGPEGHAAGAFEGTILREVAARVPPDWILFVSSSMPVRDLDVFGEPRRDGPVVLGNRGASGIDGIVSTAIGASLGGRRAVVAVVGDLALIHDMNGLLAARAPGVRVLFVVIQNDGGGIFHMLPVREYDPPFTRLVATPHGREVARIAELHDLVHLKVEARAGETSGPPDRVVARLREALDEGMDRVGTRGESVLLEVRTDRDENQKRQREVAERVRSALTKAWTEGDR